MSEETPIELYVKRNGETVKFVRYEEIERLNNIINELEKILEEEREKDRPRDDYNYGVGNTLDYIWYKLQELKGSDKK